MKIFGNCALVTSAEILLDTSAAIALMLKHDPRHDKVRDATRNLARGLAGHALAETYSVLTRLPGTSRVAAPKAADMIERAFPASVALEPKVAVQAVSILAAAGIAGGAVYDGLVALAARESGIRLLSCDRRALPTYRALGVDVEII